jgi:hypothetical protein
MSQEEQKKANTQEVGGMKISWDDSDISSQYANIATATATREEFFLLFGTHQNWRGDERDKLVSVKLSNRMVLSPFAAKRFMLILQHSIKAYENKFGKIGE